MPVSTPNGYLDFTNATPRATKVIATSNVGVGFNDPLHALDVAGTANVGALTATSVGVPDLTLATLAANLVTYDSSTGIFQDSGGLFSNKLAVVSEQPPSALGGASTTVEKHGVYKVTASTGTPQNAFDKATGTSWVGSSSYTGGSGTGVYVGSTTLATGLKQGDWLAVEFPYKATLRHLTFTATDTPTGALPNKANLYATNDSLVWTELKNWESNENTIVVNATEAYKKFALVTTKTRDSNSTLEIGQLKLFCESFSVDGGKIEMATSAITGGETVVEQTTAHAREPAVLKKYPEVAFAEGKFEYNHDSNTYTQGGYTVSASNDSSRMVWQLFNESNTEAWGTNGGAYNTGQPGTVATSGSYPGEIITLADGTQHDRGHWAKLKLPYKVRLSKYFIRARSTDRRPASISILGSNDDSNWYIVKDTHTVGSDDQYTVDISASVAYRYVMLLVHSIVGSDNQMKLDELQYYGYEETNTTGDLSLDTTITSKYNTPDLTNAPLYLDGLKGSTATDYSGNDLTVTENNVTYDSTEKSWTLSGAATSNIVSGDLGLEGDQPHSVSAWVKADVLNGDGLFHVGTTEGKGDAASRVGFVDDSHISWGGEDHFFSNAEWHNVTYTYNGEGSDKKLYLDGRLVGTASNEDTFGDYPPFAMSTYSEYGYTVSASSQLSNYPVHYAFDGNTTHASSANSWISAAGKYDSTGGTGLPVSPAETTTVDGVSKEGEWVQMEFTQRMIFDSVSLAPQTDSEQYRAPKDAVIAGSNDGTTWETMRTFTGETSWTDNVFNNYVIDTNVGKSYKYVRIIILRNQGTPSSSTQYTAIAEIKFYARRENDLVRFPDPTNVLKYPHVAMTGPAQRGYVVEVSSRYNYTDVEYEPWQSFAWKTPGTQSPYDAGWVSINTSYSTSSPYNANSNESLSGIDGVGSRNGAYMIVTFPRKLAISALDMYTRSATTSSRVTDGYIYGSQDKTTWYEIAQISVDSDANLGSYTNTTPCVVTTDSTTPYKYAAIHATSVGNDSGYVSFGKLEFSGTEPEDVVARVGDGYDGKVRNLRVFSTALSDDRVQEIFDADKDEFGLAKSVVSVYRGHLGIGTTTPTAALTVMDEVAELEEFPPRGLADAKETYIEGHGVFKIHASIFSTGTNGVTNAFDKKSLGSGESFWLVGNNAGYNLSTGVYEDNAYKLSPSSGTPYGHWVALEMPYKIKLKKYSFMPRYNTDYQAPKDWELWASNDGGTWTKITQVVGNTEYLKEVTYHVDETNYYKYIAFIVTKVIAGHASNDYVAVAELRYFGTREQGASTLHNGELTLTRNLTVPRIGPPLDADDTPRRDRLVVEYNTSTNPTENGVVKDTSGRENDGFMYNGASYDATEKALVFDGTNDYVTRQLYGISGDFKFSASLWVYHTNTTNNQPQFFVIGENATNKMIGFRLNNSMTSVYVYFYGANTLTSTISTVLNVWNHFVVIYDGSTQSLYQNGVLAGSQAGSGLNLPQNPELRIGYRPTGGSNEYLDGYLSNFKLYDCALTASEVKTLYDMGRHGNVIAQPLYITAPIHAPGVPIQMVTKQVHDLIAYSAADNIHIAAMDIKITPKFANSKIMIEWNVFYEIHHDYVFRIYRDGTLIGINKGTSNHYSGAAAVAYDQNTDTTPSQAHILWVDTPNTTSSITYKLYCKDAAGTSFYAFNLNRPNAGTGINNEIGVSHAIVTEIAQ